MVIPNRVHGGTSLRQGSIELMVHRHIPNDDGKGLCENYVEYIDQKNSTAAEGIKVKTSYLVRLEQLAEPSDTWRQLQMRVMDPPQVFYTFKSPSSLNSLSHGDPLGFVGDQVRVQVTNEEDLESVSIRFENLSDKTSPTVRVSDMIEEYWGENMCITETTLNGFEKGGEVSTVRLAPFELRTFRFSNN